MRGVPAEPSSDCSELQVGQLRGALEAVLAWATGSSPNEDTITALMNGCLQFPFGPQFAGPRENAPLRFAASACKLHVCIRC